MNSQISYIVKVVDLISMYLLRVNTLLTMKMGLDIYYVRGVLNFDRYSWCEGNAFKELMLWLIYMDIDCEILHKE